MAPRDALISTGGPQVARLRGSIVSSNHAMEPSNGPKRGRPSRAVSPALRERMSRFEAGLPSSQVVQAPVRSSVSRAAAQQYQSAAGGGNEPLERSSPRIASSQAVQQYNQQLIPVTEARKRSPRSFPSQVRAQQHNQLAALHKAPKRSPRFSQAARTQLANQVAQLPPPKSLPMRQRSKPPEKIPLLPPESMRSDFTEKAVKAAPTRFILAVRRYRTERVGAASRPATTKQSRVHWGAPRAVEASFGRKAIKISTIARVENRGTA